MNETPTDSMDHSEIITREKSLSDRLIHQRTGVKEKTDTVEVLLDDGPAELTVRGLSRGEYLIASKRFGDDEAAKEQWLASRAVIDPPLTPEEVKIWQEVSGPTEINEVMMRVNRLSGISQGAEKS